MCGLVGMFALGSGVQAPSPNLVCNMLARIGHRGPDEAGYRIDERAALGAVRLSILDLEGGQQPVSLDEGRWWISYNGELYNYIELREELARLGVRCHSQGDTEVVLRAWMTWGEDCLKRFNGAFAFAIYDRLEGRLVLARDRYGKRPLFYTRAGGRLYFASEMKAFLAVSDISFEFDKDQLASILVQWTPLPEQTGWRDIHQLPMASWMKIESDGSTSIHQYEDLRFSSKLEIKSAEEAAGIVRERLRESVRLRLRSDVEVGVYLSGGLDSAIVASLAVELGLQAPRTFSVEFDDDGLDESAHQKVMADHLGTRHKGLRITDSDIADAFPAAVYHAEVPVFRTAFVPMYLLSRDVHDDGIKTILSGEGADEIFLGYGLFRETLLRRQWNNLDNEERKQRIALLNPYLGHYSQERHGHLLGFYQQYSEERLPGLFSHEVRLQNGRFATRLLHDGPADPLAPLNTLIAHTPGYADFSDIEKAQWLEFRTLLSGYLLSTQGERMGMAHGVENRCPFLDPAVVGLAGAVNLRFDGGWLEKDVLKRAFPNLPKSVLERHKHPYRAPDSAAFVKARPDYMDALLSQESLSKIDAVDARFATSLVRKILTQSPERISIRENQAFIYLMSMMLLHRQFVLRESQPDTLASAIESRLVVAEDYRRAA
ncbi:MAG TPA: asparagine synthase (glutamine-hydrolyzing) [Magnetovibrio sp.]